VYEVFLGNSAIRNLRRLAPKIHDRIVEEIQSLSDDPRPAEYRKLAGSENDWRIRVGEYRVIYEIADAIRVVRIHRVRHRREVYR
jgi:mRNA interferase RelE/StbE